MARQFSETLYPRTEFDEQVAVIAYIKLLYPKTLMTIAPAGIKMNIRTGLRFRKMGYSVGTPDILIFEPRGKYHGLLIEMKKIGGKVSKAQKRWIAEANKRLYKVVVCYGAVQAYEIINKYFDEKS